MTYSRTFLKKNEAAGLAKIHVAASGGGVSRGVVDCRGMRYNEA
jgi:hypothetical protein